MSGSRAARCLGGRLIKVDEDNISGKGTTNEAKTGRRDKGCQGS